MTPNDVPEKSEKTGALLEFHLDRARQSIEDPHGAIWPVNSFSDADELNSLFETAVHSGIIASRDPGALIHIYPLSLSDPEPVLALSRGTGPSLLGFADAPRASRRESARVHAAPARGDDD